MTKSSYFDPLKRSYRNWLRKRNRVLVTQIPPPFFHAKDIDAVRQYFSGFVDEQDNRVSNLPTTINGFCYLCNQQVDFAVSRPTDGSPVNWRETLSCPQCKLINRWRSCLHVFEALCTPTVDDRIYLTETLSLVHENLAGRFPGLSASEYLPNREFGELTLQHGVLIRNEDVTKLRFDDASQEIVLCFDVLEHVHDYRAALREFYRVLSSGGQLVISVPFSFRHETLVRAIVDDNGNVKHLMEPCYHGDPLSDQGVLSFYDFGMTLLDDLGEAGFQESFVVCFHSDKWAYLDDNVVFIARKLKSSVSKRSLVKSAWQRTVSRAGLITESLSEYARYRRQTLQKRVSRLFWIGPSVQSRTTQTANSPVTVMSGETELPEIFHYWSNKHISADMSRFGFSNPEEFIFQYTTAYLKDSAPQRINILSLASGDCGFELDFAKQLLHWRLDNFVIECLEGNPDKLSSGKDAVETAGLSEYFEFTREDVNTWKPYKKYGIVLAHYSLHDARNLEGLFDSVKLSLKPDGLFIVADLIGRNGQMHWPEAMDALKPFWNELPQSYRYNRVLQRQEEQFINHDRSVAEQVGLRSQDILPLLLERFNFKFFYPYGNIIFAFIDRAFGHNFDVEAEWDKDFVDRVHAHDEAGILSGELTPASMLAVLKKQETEMVLKHPVLTPEHCVRKSFDDGRSERRRAH
jgi:SAM-dependent methyltransferase